MKRIQLKGRITYAIIALCVVITLCITFLSFNGSQTDTAIFFGAYYKAFVVAGEYWRLLTCGFIHVNLLHLAMNMYSLYILGRAMETSLGEWRFLVLLLASIVGGTVFLYCVAGNTVGVGISGGLYGLLAAYIYMVAEAGALKISQVRNGVFQTVGMNLLINFMPGVAWQAHLGGAITGILTVMVIRKNPLNTNVQKHAMVALAALVIAGGVAFYQSSNIDSSQIYLRTDLNVLKMEYTAGFKQHARRMAVKLDTLYDVTYLQIMLEEPTNDKTL